MAKHPPGCFPGTRHPSDHIQKPLAPDANASQNGYRRLIPALAVSSCSWDSHPSNSLGRTATREHQHTVGVCGEPRGSQSFDPLCTPGHGNPRPPPGERTWGPPASPPRLPKHSRRDKLPLARLERKEEKPAEARPGCKTLGHHCRQSNN